jgi:hypothetical protein
MKDCQEGAKSAVFQPGTLGSSLSKLTDQQNKKIHYFSHSTVVVEKNVIFDTPKLHNKKYL